MQGWITLFGGITGLIMIVYMLLMIYYAHKKNDTTYALRIDIARLEGKLDGIMSSMQTRHDLSYSERKHLPK